MISRGTQFPHTDNVFAEDRERFLKLNMPNHRALREPNVFVVAVEPRGSTPG